MKPELTNDELRELSNATNQESQMEEFKLIVAGGRDFDDYPLLHKTLFELTSVTYADRKVSIVSGMARGTDALGFRLARKENIQVYTFPADWDQYGKRAGFIRNEKMGAFADGLLAFWDGASRGTKHMIEYMQSLNKPVYIVRY